jgi:signal transduction histidine kinase
LSVKVGSHVLVAFIGLDKLSKFFSGFSRREGVSLALVDRNGAFLYHSSQNLVEDRSNFLQFPELQAKARMGQKLVTIQLDGRSWDASLRPLALTGWSILLLSDPFVTYNSVFMLAISIMGITLLLLIILSLGSVNLFRRLLEPLDRFMSQIQKASHGTLEKMPEGENFEEFRVLGNHFNRMVQNIDDRQTQFVRANEKLNVELQENQKSNEAFQTIMRTLARATGDDLFRLISKTVSDWLRVDLVFVGELSPDGTAIVFRGALGGDFEQSSLSFAVADSLCERALLQGFFLQEGACWKDFYQSRELEMIRPEGFLGVSIRDAAGRNIGVLAVYSKSVLQVPRRASEVLRILADRCASEIQRMHQEVAFKRLNLELGDMARSLGVKNREMESMLYATSHDLKAPLVNISGFAKELNGTLDDFQKILQRERVSLPREATEILQTDVPHCVSYIQNGASRMDRLIAGLLKLFRVGRLQMEFKPVDLTALLSNIREEMRFSLTESKTEMEIGDLAHCVGDENQLAQVFQNLLSNSLKYQSPDRNLRITIRGRVVDRHVEIEFEDNGQGIPEKQKDRVFQLFFRAGNSQGVPGDGIGLAIVHRILDQHSGNISLESTEGVGTTFLIRLPVGK